MGLVSGRRTQSPFVASRGLLVALCSGRAEESGIIATSQRATRAVPDLTLKKEEHNS